MNSLTFHEQEFCDKIVKAAQYIKNGDPIKDVLDHEEVLQAIELLAMLIKRGFVI